MQRFTRELENEGIPAICCKKKETGSVRKTAWPVHRICSLDGASRLKLSLTANQLESGMMDYEATLEYLYKMLPMYQRQGPVAYKKDLSNTLALTNAMGRPHLRFPSIHIAGTNGKGSVAHLCAAVLQSAGYRVGLYTSPHLKDFRERIRLNGEMVSREEVVQFVQKHRQLIEDISPSFFEATVAMAFERFAEWEVEIAVVETGLGGRLDSTNIIHPILSVITSIGHDHQALLGPDLASIAGEKAGIIKSGVPVVIGEWRAETYPVFVRQAEALQAPLFLAPETISLEEVEQTKRGLEFRWRKAGGKRSPLLCCGLAGDYQQTNLKTVLQTLLLVEECGFSIPESALKNGLADVCRLTGFRGRWDVLQQNPLVVADGAHNPEGLQILFEQVRRIACSKLRIVTGTVNDKDLKGVLPCFPQQAQYYFSRPDIPRGLDALILQEKAAGLGLTGKVYSSVVAALDAALSDAAPDDFILICGSLFVIAEIPFENFENDPDRLVEALI